MTPPLHGGWTRRQSAKCVTTTGDHIRDHTHIIHPNPLTHFLSPISSQWCPRPVRRNLSSDPVALFCPLQAFLSSPSSASPLFSPQEGVPTSALVSLFLHLFSLLIRAGIESHPGPVQDPCSVCGSCVQAGWVAFLCMVCDQWCHRRCAGIHSIADNRRSLTASSSRLDIDPRRDDDASPMLSYRCI